MSIQKIIDTHIWKNFIPEDFVNPIRKYFRCMACGVIVFNDYRDSLYYYSLSDYNWDYGLKIHSR